MTGPKTVSEKILSVKSGRDACAGDVVICNVDLVLGTDASSPMAIDYFKRMGGQRLFDAARVLFSFDHYSPPACDQTRAFHDRVRAFVANVGGTILEVGEGISFQVAVERGLVGPGDLVVGADSHVVTCGALNLLAVGVGSSDLAAAMLTGQIWLRVPETILVRLVGRRPPGLAAKDAALALVAAIGADGANYQSIEFGGPALDQFSLEDRLVFSNLAVETGAKVAIFPADEMMDDYLADRTNRRQAPVRADPGARYSREVVLDVSALGPRVALPHAPDNVVPITRVAGTPIQMVPASREVERQLTEDGSLAELVRMGATVTTPGCGACCGTSGVIPTEGASVLSTANRNFKARMGPASVSIYLASPAACAAAALSGRITDPGAARA